MSLVRLDGVNLAYGERKLLIDADLAIEKDELLCLVGRNGAGKSTLLKIITGHIIPDGGEVVRASQVSIASLDQELPSQLTSSVRDLVRGGLDHLDLLHRRAQQLAEEPIANAEELTSIQSRLDALGGWHPQVLVDTIISQLDLPADLRLEHLSGGWRRRVMLGRALVSKPDLLLLDEPTNHLDISTIEWLEGVMHSFSGAVVFITHDRRLATTLATRVVEIDRGRLISWPGDFVNYLRRKLETEQTEDRNHALFDKRLQQEEAWVRQGIKARRTRNEGRVRALEAMREVSAARIKRPGKPRISIHAGEASGRKVIEARNLGHAFGGEQLIRGFSITITRGERIGIVGNNGVGKSTLLKILLGDIQPELGKVKIGEGVRPGYFDQTHRALDPDKSLIDNINEGRDYVQIGGKERHVVGYLRNYLFDYKRASTPVQALSGGERNRVLLARLFSREHNLLVLDEPTNDLDIELLEVLEEALTDYAGTLLIVSHDRMFLDGVVTRLLVFEEGGLHNYVGNYSHWLGLGKKLKTIAETSGVTQNPTNTSRKARQSQEKPTTLKPAKLSYKLKRELEQLPGRIEAMESELAGLRGRIANPAFFSQDHQHANASLKQAAELEEAVNQATERWYKLSEMEVGRKQS